MTIATLDPAVAPTAAPAIVPHDQASPTTGAPIAWAGDADLERLIWRNAALVAASCGAYTFWAKVAWRRSLWHAVRIKGEPLRFTGTVSEILWPFVGLLLVVVGAVVAVILMKWYGAPRLPMPRRSVRLAASIPIVFLLGLSAWSARAYILSRTSIRGEPGRLEGSPLAYALTHFFSAFLTPLTLGLALPWRQAWLQRRLIGGMVLGPHRFAFEGAKPAELVTRFLAVWAAGLVIYLAAVLAIAFSSLGRKVAAAQHLGTWPVPDRQELAFLVCLGLVAGLAFTAIAAWYRIGVLRHFASATRIDGTPLRLEAETSAYVTLAVGNWIIRVGSLFILSPLAELRMTRFLIRSLRAARPH